MMMLQIGVSSTLLQSLCRVLKWGDLSRWIRERSRSAESRSARCEIVVDETEDAQTWWNEQEFCFPDTNGSVLHSFDSNLGD